MSQEKTREQTNVTMLHKTKFDVAVVGGGPAGATAAAELAKAGVSVVLFDRGNRIKPCGGAIPPVLVEEFAIPTQLLVAQVHSARMISPSNQEVDMPIEGGYVGMVNREEFDPWLRNRAELFGATLKQGKCLSFNRVDQNTIEIKFRPNKSGPSKAQSNAVHSRDEEANVASSSEPIEDQSFTVRSVIGADGANSMVAKQFVPGGDKIPYVAAYHEIVETPVENFDGSRCDVWYQGRISPDFYGWVFPHGDKTSIGVGSANKGFSLKSATAELRKSANLDTAKMVRCEGAPIPLKPLKRWDDGNNVLLAGDAAGIVAPASGEGIYYAMVGGKLAAESVAQLLATGDVRALKLARKKFMKAHGRVFWVLGLLQKFWYSSDKRRERFVSMCRDPDVQHLTWQAYMHKKLVRAKPVAHARIFFKDLAHLLGVVKP